MLQVISELNSLTISVTTLGEATKQQEMLVICYVTVDDLVQSVSWTVIYDANRNKNSDTTQHLEHYVV